LLIEANALPTGTLFQAHLHPRAELAKKRLAVLDRSKDVRHVFAQVVKTISLAQAMDTQDPLLVDKDTRELLQLAGLSPADLDVQLRQRYIQQEVSK
jgi:hypothetical protein